MPHVQHVRREPIVKPIAVDVREVNRHGKGAGGANGWSWQRPEMGVTVIDPDSVGSLEIVADVKVRGAVAVQVAKRRAEAPISRRLDQRPAILVQKYPICPGLPLEIS